MAGVEKSFVLESGRSGITVPLMLERDPTVSLFVVTTGFVECRFEFSSDGLDWFDVEENVLEVGDVLHPNQISTSVWHCRAHAGFARVVVTNMDESIVNVKVTLRRSNVLIDNEPMVIDGEPISDNNPVPISGVITGAVEVEQGDPEALATLVHGWDGTAPKRVKLDGEGRVETRFLSPDVDVVTAVAYVQDTVATKRASADIQTFYGVQGTGTQLPGAYNLCGFVISFAGSVFSSVHFYDEAGSADGTTTPVFSVGVPPESVTSVTLPGPVFFSNGISLRFTNGTTNGTIDSGAPPLVLANNMISLSFTSGDTWSEPDPAA